MQVYVGDLVRELCAGVPACFTHVIVWLTSRKHQIRLCQAYVMTVEAKGRPRKTRRHRCGNIVSRNVPSVCKRGNICRGRKMLIEWKFIVIEFYQNAYKKMPLSMIRENASVDQYYDKTIPILLNKCTVW